MLTILPLEVVVSSSGSCWGGLSAKLSNLRNGLARQCRLMSAVVQDRDERPAEGAPPPCCAVLWCCHQADPLHDYYGVHGLWQHGRHVQVRGCSCPPGELPQLDTAKGTAMGADGSLCCSCSSRHRCGLQLLHMLLCANYLLSAWLLASLPVYLSVCLPACLPGCQLTLPGCDDVLFGLR